ncbi:MAG: hypothetical protein F6K28_41635, partial [Microcoleus sp. SIO2G3]|nr:hypothetical protein [Microcoleus sp. SIO2G3]
MSQFNSPDVQVNSTLVDDQRLASSRRSIAIRNTGESVVVWQSVGQDGSLDGVFARRIDATGQPQGAEIQVNETIANRQGNAAVAMDAATGSFVVVWQSFDPSLFANDIYARRFNADGTPDGGEFIVNIPDGVNDEFDQQLPNLALTPDGGFIATWTSQNQDGEGQGIYARRFNASGQTIEFVTNSGTDTEVLINQTTAGNQS